MSLAPTPESDAAEIVQTFKGLPDCRTGRVSIEFARKLERERDALKEEYKLALESADAHNHQLATTLEKTRSIFIEH
jgi:hypothetical protein